MPTPSAHQAGIRPLFPPSGPCLALALAAQPCENPLSRGCGELGATCHANFEPPVGGRQEEGGDVVGVRVFKELLLEPGLVPGGRMGRVRGNNLGPCSPRDFPHLQRGLPGPQQPPDMPPLPPYGCHSFLELLPSSLLLIQTCQRCHLLQTLVFTPRPVLLCRASLLQ